MRVNLQRQNLTGEPIKDSCILAFFLMVVFLLRTVGLPSGFSSCVTPQQNMLSSQLGFRGLVYLVFFYIFLVSGIPFTN